MLNVTPQRSSAAAKSYFAQSDYYAEGQQEIIGDWGGKGAVLAGLFGQVNKHAFDALCDNLHPKTGERRGAHGVSHVPRRWPACRKGGNLCPKKLLDAAA